LAHSKGRTGISFRNGRINRVERRYSEKIADCGTGQKLTEERQRRKLRAAIAGFGGDATAFRLTMFLCGLIALLACAGNVGAVFELNHLAGCRDASAVANFADIIFNPASRALISLCFHGWRASMRDQQLTRRGFTAQLIYNRHGEGVSVKTGHLLWRDQILTSPQNGTEALSAHLVSGETSDNSGAREKSRPFKNSTRAALEAVALPCAAVVRRMRLERLPETESEIATNSLYARFPLWC
jgi:hypothetical protein